MNYEQTFNHFLLQHQIKHGRTLNFLILMEAILTAARYIQYYYESGALDRNLGLHGTENVQGEEVMKLDHIANEIVMHYLRQSKQVMQVVSEEEDEPIKIDADGRYLLYLDPLDGSSNVKHGLPVGFMFGIAKRNLEGEEDYHLRKGRDYIAAGMFSIPTGFFTFGLRNTGTWRFILDKTGVFIRPEKVSLPAEQKTWELSYNAGYTDYYSDKVKAWLDDNSKNYAFRYAGALAIDFHRLLDNGGMYMYPAIVNHPEKNYPNGKIRLMYECSVVAFLAHEAGGLACDEEGNNILDIVPNDCHQRSSIFVGSKEVVEGIVKG